MTKSEIIDALRMELCERNLSNKAVADILGVTPSAVCNILSGRRPFTRNTAGRWAAGLGLSANFLLNGDGELVPSKENKCNEQTPTTPQEQTAAPTTNPQDGVFIPSETLQMYNDMAASIRNLTELLGGVGILKGDADFFAPKPRR